MTEEAKANQKKWDESEAWFNNEYPDHEDGCLYGKILVKAAFTAGRESRDEYLKKLLKSNIDQHNKIGFLSRKVQELQKYNNKAKEIIRECMNQMIFHDCEYTDAYNKAEAFLKE